MGISKKNAKLCRKILNLIQNPSCENHSILYKRFLVSSQAQNYFTEKYKNSQKKPRR